ncbi:MAG: hypothetical protein WD226_11300 [Planctomycetota bacterium]
MSRTVTPRAVAPCIVLLVLALWLLAPLPGAQVGTVTTVPGTVEGLCSSTAGDFLYCTDQGFVGRMQSNGVRSTLAGPADGLTTDAQPLGGGNFPARLTDVTEAGNGDVFVLDDAGNIWRLANGVGTPIALYRDIYMIHDASALVIDQSGNFLIASQTPSSGQRGLNWVSADGQRWAYYAVEDQPLGLGADPVTGNVYMTDRDGFIRLIDVGESSHPTTIVDADVFGFPAGGGDLAVETDGDVALIAGNQVWKYDRLLGASSISASVGGNLTAVAIGGSSGNVPSGTGFSAYVAEGSNPTTIREIGNFGAPASLVASQLGSPPGPGHYVQFYQMLTAMDLNVDRAGKLLVSGDRWGQRLAVWRIDPNTSTQTLVADENDGVTGKVEGITIDEDGTIWCVTTAGHVQAIRENPLSVTTVFSNPNGEITQGKDIAVGRDGTIYVADRECFGCGEVRAIDPVTGQSWQVTPVNECKSVSTDAFTGQLLVSEWNGTGFHGTVNRCELATGQMSTLPGFEFINYSNEAVRGDGDALMDVNGSVYTCSYDDWRVTRWDPATQRYTVVGSGYLRVVTGLAIAGSRNATASSTGFSLYVTDNDQLWEIPDVAPPAPQRVDPDAPGPGALLGWVSGRLGRPRAMIADPAGGALVVSTAASQLVRIDTATGASQQVAGTPQGLGGDLMAIAARADGQLYVAAGDGRVWLVNPNAGWNASLVYAGSLLGDVRGMTVDGTGSIVLVDRIAPNSHASRVWRLENGALSPIAYAARGARPAIDPLTAEVWVSQQGTPNESAGELLRIDTSFANVRVGNHRHDGYRTYGVGERDGDLAFAANGDLLVAAGREGRVWRMDRGSGVPTTIGGNYDEPVAVALAPGRPGIAGPAGSSAFVLDGWVVWEIGTAGTGAGAPPASNPGLGAPVDLWTVGLAGVGTVHHVAIRQPAEANELYIMLPTLAGKEPGLPLFILEPGDPRVFPNNIHPWWNIALSPNPAFASFFGILDQFGENPGSAGVALPLSTSVLALGRFVDFAWVSIQPGMPQPVDYVGGTSCLYLGL